MATQRHGLGLIPEEVTKQSTDRGHWEQLPTRPRLACLGLEAEAWAEEEGLWELQVQEAGPSPFWSLLACDSAWVP